MFGLCKKFIERGVKPTLVLGFNTASDVFYKNEFKELGVTPLISTADGSYGIKGFVTDAIKTLDDSFSSYCACGPEPMLKALATELKDIKGQLSFEERMACGFGACMGCSCQTKYGYKRICKDGPVLKSDEVIW
jgi:dihydroorotate dehydrogenase electron transfer subunit